ncbi:MAG: CHAT domain-containing protein [Spirulinaceae cyanobacterium]
MQAAEPQVGRSLVEPGNEGAEPDVIGQMLAEKQTSDELRTEQEAKDLCIKGIGLYKDGKRSHAIKLWTQAIEMYPRLATAYLVRGIAHYESKKHQEAITDLSEVIRINPYMMEAHSSLGLVYSDLKFYEEAIASYTRAIDLNPDHTFAFVMRGVANFELKQYEEAIEDFNRVIETNGVTEVELADTYNSRGLVNLELKQYEEAIEDFSAVIKINSQHSHAYHNRGMAHHNMQLYEEAISDHSKAVDIDPKHIESYNGRGCSYLSLKRYAKAIDDFTKSIEMNSLDSVYYSNRGQAYEELKQYKNAIADYDRAIEVDSSYTLAYCKRGNTYVHLDSYQEAISDYNQAINIEPRNIEAYGGLGNAYLGLNLYEQALSNYNQVISIDPSLWSAWAMRGQVIFDIHGCDKAIENYDEGLRSIGQVKDVCGCSMLLFLKGFSRYQHGQKITSEASIYFDQAVQDYKSAYELVQSNGIYVTDTLRILKNWIKAEYALKRNRIVDDLILDSIQRLSKALQAADLDYRQVLRAEFHDFYTLEFNRIIRTKGTWLALAEAEKWKTLALQWLTNPQAEPQESQTDLQTCVNHLCQSPHTTILYWHLSPAQITTFLLRPNQDPQVFTTPCDPPYTPETKTQTNFTEWLKHYKELYEAQRKKKGEDSVGAIPPWLPQTGSSATASEAGSGNEAAETKTSSGATETGVGTGALPLQKDGELNWQTQLPQLLADLAKILKINEILPHLADSQHLILIPHRDLHLLPLHALFQSAPALLGKEGAGKGFSITYLPQLTLPPTPNTPPPNTTPTLIGYPTSHQQIRFARLETHLVAHLLAPSYPQAQPLTADHVTPHAFAQYLQTPAPFLHFTGHGAHDAANPNNSALYLTNDEPFTLQQLLELKTLNLPLVCLAACETGISNQGEFINEFVGFPAAFLAQGSRTVLSTLWTVDEQSSMIFMVEFFRHYQQHHRPAAALRHAQTQLQTLTWRDLEQWYRAAIHDDLGFSDKSWLRSQANNITNDTAKYPPHHCPYATPYHWAGFILTGAP